ncbi:MAG: hypothetical protein NC924_10390 [Candidatus Omnitrophica bacterium]|nr:hypothetical protein [Candidatus Omnitrophota bacterium]
MTRRLEICIRASVRPVSCAGGCGAEKKLMRLVKAVIVSLAFCCGFYLLNRFFPKNIARKKIVTALIEVIYFVVFWWLVYFRFLDD